MYTSLLMGHKLFRAACAIVVLLLLSACTQLIRPNFTAQLSELRSGQYRLDTEHAYVHFKVEHLGLSTVVGRFNTVNGSLDFNPDNLEALVLEGQIDASSVDMNNADLEDTLMGRDWFNVASFSEIRFTSQSAKLNEQGAVIINGILNLRGVSQAIVLEARFNGGADNVLTGKYTLGFTANARISRSAFGLNAIGALVGDDVRIELFGEFQKN